MKEKQLELKNFLNFVEFSTESKCNPINSIVVENLSQLQELTRDITNAYLVNLPNDEILPSKMMQKFEMALKTYTHVLLAVSDTLPKYLFDAISAWANDDEYKDVPYLPINEFIYMCGERQVLENQHRNLLNLGCHVKDLS